VDFTAASSEVGVVVKRLPQVVDGFASRFGTGIDEYTDFRLSGNLSGSLVSRRIDAHLKYFTDTIEEPSVGIDLFLVLSLQD
jgi:hypothetical protein